MLQSRARKLDRNSLKYLYKVCNSSRSSLLDFVKTFCFVRNFSNLNALPTDERFDFQNSREFSAENDLNRANNGEVSSGYGKDWSFRGSNGGFGGNSNVVYRENSMGTQQNTSGGYWQSPNFSNNSGGSRNEVYSKNYMGVEQNSSGGYWQSPNLSNNFGGNPNGVYRGNSMGVQQNTSGGYWQSPSYSNNYGGSQNEVYRENSMGKDQNPSGGYLQNHNEVYRESSMGVQQNPSGDYWQSQNGVYRESSMGVQQNPSGGYWQSPNFSNNPGGSYNQTPNHSYNGLGNSQVSSYTQPAEDTVDAGEDGQLRGTIEELDFFCKEQKLKEAMEVLGLLEQHKISVDIPRYILLMKECGEAKALEEAKYVHEHLLRSVSHLDVSICNKILEMYSKCGSMDDAYLVFHRMAQRNLTSWDTMITWLAKNGHGEDAIDMFTEFKKIGLKPDSLMFFGVFKACSVLGDMEEGLLHFESMSKKYGIVPSMGHYVSVVEMLGSAGYLIEALEFIEKMPMEPGVDIWEIMMNQCRIHGDTELGDRCAEFVEQLEPSRLDELSKAGLIPVKASDIAREKEQKRSSFNPLEIKTKIYEYRAGDTSHPEHEKLYALLRCLKQAMKEAGYVPETKFVLHDIDQESKEEALLSHSERLALAQALMTSSARSQIRIMKNLRVCGDCHNALKIISKLVGRRIVARDAKRFHHFENGEHIAPFVSSIFLRKLFLPGIYHDSVLRATLQDHNKHLTDSEFHSLTADGMKKEIVSLIEHEGVSRSSLSVLYCWKTFCADYFNNWCNKNAPRGLLIDSSTGAIGLMRKSSVSLLRSLEDIELLAFGSFDELGDILSSRIDFSDDDVGREVLLEVLRCTSFLSQELGKGSSALFYESFFNEPSEDVVRLLLKILETGHTPSVAALHVSELGVDTAWEKEVADHKNLRKFSTDMFLSLHRVHNKASTWDKVLDVILNYLKFFVPGKTAHRLESEAVFGISTCMTVQVTSQVARVMFESAVDMLLLLSYMVKISGQINMLHDDVSRIQLELLPMIEEVITEWHVIHFFGTTASESPAVEDFSTQLSSLQIDSSIDKRSWNEKLGKCDFTLAFVLLLDNQCSSEGQSFVAYRHLPCPSYFIDSARKFTSWILWGSRDESSAFFSHSIELALILLKHGQFDAVEHLLTTVDKHLHKEKTSDSIQGVNDEWCTLLHLLGCCLLAQAQSRGSRTSAEKKVREAIRCFFRAASVHGAPQSLQRLPKASGMPHLGFTDLVPPATWKLHYYQWAMQIFERYNMSEGACLFALAALEQVDEVLGLKDADSGADFLNESPNTVKGRLWANVFKFTLDLNYYHDAYCAIISNPDEESKYICLRRFIIVLYERGAVKILCDGQLPFIGLAEKVEQELAWKAERSDISVKPNPYEILYAFEMNQHNWRRAASYIYLHSVQLKNEAALKDHQLRSLALQERLNCLSATINALHLVHPACAWIDPLFHGKSLQKELYPSKRARMTSPGQEPDDQLLSQKMDSCMDIEKLEHEFVLTSAEYLLSLANVRWTFTGTDSAVILHQYFHFQNSGHVSLGRKKLMLNCIKPYFFLK